MKYFIKETDKIVNPKTDMTRHPYHYKKIKREKIEGQTKVIKDNPCSIDGMRELMIDKEGKSLLIYSEKDRWMMEKRLSYIRNIEGLESSSYTDKEDGTTAYYLCFKLDGTNFKVRMSDHTYSSVPDGLVVGLRFVDFRKTWTIDVGIGRYTPAEVVEIVNHLRADLSKYRSRTKVKELNQFFKANKNNYCLQDDDLEYMLAVDFMNEKGISDSKYGTTFCVLCVKFQNVISRELKSKSYKS